MPTTHRLRESLAARHYSLSVKIIGLCVAATMGAMVLTFGLFQWQDFSGDRSDLVAEQLGNARSLAAVASVGVENSIPGATAKAEVMFENDEAALAASYVSATGRQLAMRRPGRSAVVLRPSGALHETANFRAGMLEVHVPVTARGRRCGELIVVASEADIWRKFNQNCLVALGLSLIGAVLSGLVARILVRNALRPLEHLGKTMAAISLTKDFSVAVEPGLNDEVGRLIREFNGLVVELNTYEGDLKRAMADLTLAKNTAEEANVMKSQFLANMSHEIRTPLNGVLGMAQVMAMNPLTEAQKDRLDVIQKSGANLLSVLNDLLDLSKIEAGRMELEQEPFDIEEVASGAYSTFTSVANASGVSFSLVITPEAAGRWRGDSVRVRQILYNLISNALKFTSEGQVEVRIGTASSEDGKALSITVADTGIGIAPEVLPKLFAKFVQADGTMTRRFGGTGLGLTICRRMVELMGGTVAIESKLGEGTTLHVHLPLPWLGPVIVLPSPPAASDTDGSSDSGLEGMRILAAEDNATNQLVLKTVLHSLGLVPVIVDDGREALEAWSNARFDLILMDIQMPQMDGVAATREIRRREAESGAPRTPIVALSANAMKHQVAEYLAAGMDSHLAKPIEIGKLYATLVAVMTGQALLEDASRAA